MKYQLVLQFQFFDQSDYDKLIELEDALIDGLQASADVDGHDAGSHEANIFIFTDTPTETFLQSKSIVVEKALLENLSAAYRSTDAEEYIRLWPEYSSEIFKLQ